MNKEQQKIEDQTRNLLRKSTLKPISEDFNDHLMQQIIQSPPPLGIKLKNNYARKAWFFLGIAISCLLVSLFLIGEFSEEYFKELTVSLSITLNYVLYGGLLLFIPLILYFYVCYR